MFVREALVSLSGSVIVMKYVFHAPPNPFSLLSADFSSLFAMKALAPSGSVVMKDVKSFKGIMETSLGAQYQFF